MKEFSCKFAVGQIVAHKLFDYRGVVFDVDPVFQGTEEWYEFMAKSRPPKNRPWYRLLVHGSGQQTYVAERNLQPDHTRRPVNHPDVDRYFSALTNGAYTPRQRAN